jgi:hypothetical protein
MLESLDNAEQEKSDVGETHLRAISSKPHGEPQRRVKGLKSRYNLVNTDTYFRKSFVLHMNNGKEYTFVPLNGDVLA